MSQAWLDLLIHILLDLCPLFRLGGRVLGNQGTKVSGVDSGKDSAFGEAVEVIQNWGSLSENTTGQGEELRTVIDGCVGRSSKLVAVHDVLAGRPEGLKFCSSDCRASDPRIAQKREKKAVQLTVKRQKKQSTSGRREGGRTLCRLPKGATAESIPPRLSIFMAHKKGNQENRGKIEDCAISP